MVGNDLPELLKRRFQVFHDLQGDDIRIGEVVGGFEGFVSQLKGFETGLIEKVYFEHNVQTFERTKYNIIDPKISFLFAIPTITTKNKKYHDARPYDVLHPSFNIRTMSLILRSP